MNKVAVYGGLGNQMFQYAFCTALNKRGNKARLSFSCYFYNNHHNGFDLARAFKIKLSPYLQAINFFLSNAGFLYKNKLAAGVFRRAVNYYEKKQNLYKEKKEFIFDSKVFSQQQVYFIGTWQSELYFKNITEQVKKEFVFNPPQDVINTNWIKEIKNCNAVSIHIRRGDYLNSQWNKRHYIIKDLSYYSNAITIINEQVTDPHFFIFSDDINWVKNNLSLSNCTYIDNNKGNNSFIDMYLMSLCRHNIIANSTFSWWAAWLNSNAKKIVIMPDKWLDGDTCEGIFPDGWIKLKV
jgi:hypothetical protein